MRYVVALLIVVLGTSLGAKMYERAEPRTPGMLYNTNVLDKMDRCMDAETRKLRDICFIISGITI